ncbi:hypothetical protein ACFQX7_00195 [Luedemannella flava]
MMGRHDDAATLRAVLSEQFRRSRQLVPMAVAERKRAGTGAAKAGSRAPNLTAHRPASLAATALAVATLPAVAVSPWLAAVPAAALVASFAADPGLVKLVRQERGLVFLGFFAVVHVLVQVTLLAAAATGAVAWLLRRRPAESWRKPVAVPAPYGLYGR